MLHSLRSEIPSFLPSLIHSSLNTVVVLTELRNATAPLLHYRDHHNVALQLERHGGDEVEEVAMLCARGIDELRKKEAVGAI